MVLIIGELKIAKYTRMHSTAKPWLDHWLVVSKAAIWRQIQDVKAAFPAVDGGIEVASGNRVTVFDVSGNHHRMIVVINYQAQRLVILELMPHAEYSKGLWKKRY